MLAAMLVVLGIHGTDCRVDPLGCLALIEDATEAPSARPEEVLRTKYINALEKLNNKLFSQLTDALSATLKSRRKSGVDLASLKQAVEHVQQWNAKHKAEPPLSPWPMLGFDKNHPRIQKYAESYAKAIDAHRRSYINGLIATVQAELDAVTARFQAETDVDQAIAQDYERTRLEARIVGYKRQLDGERVKPVFVFNGDEYAIFINGVEIASAQDSGSVHTWSAKESLLVYPGDVVALRLKSPYLYRSFRLALLRDAGEALNCDTRSVRLVNCAYAFEITAQSVAAAQLTTRGRSDESQSGNLPLAWQNAGMAESDSEWIGLPKEGTIYWFAFIIP